jgi:hypothetical protein
MVGQEMQVRLQNREGLVIDEAISPHGAAAIVLTSALSSNENNNAEIPQGQGLWAGFNQETTPLQFFSSDFNYVTMHGNNSITMSLEIEKQNDGWHEWLQLGEFYFSMDNQMSYLSNVATITVPF